MNEAKITRSFRTDTIQFESFEDQKILWEKEVEGTANDTEIVKAIQEFTDKHWDKKTPWKHVAAVDYEVYEMSQEQFKQLAKKLDGEELAARVEQIKKNKEKRGK